ncbi:CoA-transferase family III [Periconia macrospinosa]|uniref:CoA-transferase family III n=1 Tax=Periconia macrospinosa TaxID=97972 RepID=A0A2V1DWY3_9PLEO|nr:CoA-transferase family III [Periconia macrospinosa]
MPSNYRYSVPKEAQKIFHNGILQNPLLPLPPSLKTLGELVCFKGHELPSIPMNWRWAESISALKAFEATMLNHLLVQKYMIQPVEVTINTDHASLFTFSPHLAYIVEDDESTSPRVDPRNLLPYGDQNVAPPDESLYRKMATNIYKTRDGRYYHIHADGCIGSLNPDTTLTALGLPMNIKCNDRLPEVVERFQSKTAQLDAVTLDSIMNDRYRQAGTVAWSAKEYFNSEHGKANSKVGLYEIHAHRSSHPPAWWPDADGFSSSPKRPLAGLKVVDLTRVIAGPVITRSLAELGASVMRVTSRQVVDFTTVFCDLNWGKWNCSLHLKEAGDREKLKALIHDADVVVDGYRPGVMERFGFGREAIFEIVSTRDRGIIHVRENCYGWYGPWAHRSGWQGISDACCGVSLAYGQAMGLNEAVTPPFPNSDHCTGAIGSTAILHALARRGEEGGSYGVDLALNYYSQWLVRSCGVYDQGIWSDLWKGHGSPVFRHFDNTRLTVPKLIDLLHGHDEDILFNPDFFQTCRSAAIGVSIRKVRPVAHFKDDVVEMGYNVGTRGNGVDEPMWPKDLLTEIVI